MNRRNVLKALPALAAATRIVSAQDSGKQRKAHLRAAICAYTFREALQKKTMSYEDLIRFAADQGLDGIDATSYWFPDPVTDDFLFSLKRLSYRLSVPIYTLGINTELTKADAGARRQQVERIRDWVNIAQRIGASQLRVFAGKPPKGATVAQAAGWATEALKPAVAYAASRGVVIAMENHSGVTQDADLLLRMVKDVDSPWFGINLDTGNFLDRQYEQIAMCVPYAVSSHLKTNMADAARHRTPADLDRVFKIFADAGYRGYLALEDSVGADPLTAVPPVLSEMRRLAAKYSRAAA
jgi:sugar phosphate isomerase/epimerase